ncbi:MAG: DsrE family protein [Alkalilacustris sp.]
MGRFLVQIHTGPDDPNKVTLGALIAAEAARAGHQVTLFFVGDGVACLAPGRAAGLEGRGTGVLADHLAALGAAGGGVRVSLLSSEARGLGDEILAALPLPADFARPADLVALAAAADTCLSY